MMKRLPLLLMVLSGCGALVYEVAWMRMLIRVFGVTLHATSAVAAAFLGGMALGSWVAARSRGTRGLMRTYGLLEVGAALSAGAVTVVLRFLPGWAASWAAVPAGAWNEPGWTDAAVRLAVSAVVMFLPTAMLGATTPVLVRAFAGPGPEAGGWMGRLYGANTLGAVAGILFAGFLSLGYFGETATVLFGMLMSLSAGLLALRAAERAGAPAQAGAGSGGAGGTAPLLALAGAAGLSGLALQAAWTKLLIMLLGSSVYSFSATLAIQLLGNALGGLWVSSRLDGPRPAASRLGGLFVALAVAAASSLEVFRLFGLAASGRRFLYSPLGGPADLLPLAAAAAAVVLPASFLSGAVLPVLARAALDTEGESGRGYGFVFAANTAGCVLGVVAAGFWLVPAFGPEGAVAAAAGLALACGVWRLWADGAVRLASGRGAAWAASVVLAAGLAYRGRNAAVDVTVNRLEKVEAGGRLLFRMDDNEAVLTGYSTPSLGSFLLLNGIVVSGTGPVGRLLVHLPALLRDSPRRALVICFGVGNTFRAALDELGTADAVELVGSVVKAAHRFHPDIPGYLARPGARVFIDDGRRHVLASKELYDQIMVDTSPPLFSAGAVNLYSREFLALVRARLAPAGVFALWLPTPCFESDFGMVARGFTEVFPHTAAWARPGIPGILLVGSLSPVSASPEEVSRRIRSRRLAERWPEMTAELFRDGWVLDDAGMRRFAESYPAVTDDRPRTEFPLGRFLRGERLWPVPGFFWKGAPDSSPGP